VNTYVLYAGTTVWDGAVVLSHLLADTDILQQHTDDWAVANRSQQPPTTHFYDAPDVSLGEQGPQVQETGGQTCTTSAPQLLNNGSATQVPVAANEIRCLELGAGTGGVSLSLLACR
jgi:hypothetical protein